MGKPSSSTSGRETGPTHQKTILRDYVETILICVIFVIFSRAFVFQQSKIPSGSMMDTLLIGDYIMVNRFVYAPYSFEWERGLLPYREIERGDVVVFKQPDEPEVDFIKRVAGLPGDTVELRSGYLYVNGELRQEPYVMDPYRHNDRSKNLGPVEVLADHYFMLGDHRDHSQDSRYWGQVDRRLIKGRAVITWFSFYDPIEAQRRSPYLSSTQHVGSWWRKMRNIVRPCGDLPVPLQLQGKGTACTRFDRFFDIVH